MAIEIFMPALSPTMEHGTLAKWLVKEGDTVESGDVIAEIETDKATMEVESIDEGTVAKIIVAEGSENVPVGQLIAMLAEEGEDVAEVTTSNASKAAPAAAPATEAVEDKVAVPVVDALPTPVNGMITDAQTGDRIKASPLAKRIAKNEGLDLKAVTGSGPYGRIIKADVEAALKSGTAMSALAATTAGTAPAQAAAPVAASEYGPLADNPYEEKKLSGMRKVIAKRLTESKTTVPHFYLTVECELDKLLAMRKEVNAGAPEGIKVSVNDFIIKAVALALKAVPAANVQFAGDKMYWYDRADISVAVAVDGGLVTPVVKGAESKGLGAIASEVKDMATRARDGKLMPEEMSGGTFSISNLGMFGIKEFSAVINPPQGAILAVGAGEQRAVVKGGELAVATVMNCTLSCDHRAIDGAVGAEFLKAFKGFIQNPLSMML